MKSFIPSALRRNIDHVKEIVAMQQRYAIFGGVKEIINVVDLVEDSLRVNDGAFSRHELKIIREFERVPPLNVEKLSLWNCLCLPRRNPYEYYAC